MMILLTICTSPIIYICTSSIYNKLLLLIVYGIVHTTSVMYILYILLYDARLLLQLCMHNTY